MAEGSNPAIGGGIASDVFPNGNSGAAEGVPAEFSDNLVNTTWFDFPLAITGLNLLIASRLRCKP